MKIYSCGKNLLSICFFLFAVILFAENNSPSDVDDNIPPESGILLDSNKDKTTINSDNNSAENKTESEFALNLTERVQSPISNLLRVMIALIVVCVLAYIVLKLLKKSSRSFSSEDMYLKNVASIGLAQGKSIHVITLGEKAYIIGVTDSSITKIGEVEDKILIDTMNLEADRHSSLPRRDFASMVSAIFKNSKDGKSETIDENFFGAQRERLNKAAQNTSEEKR